MTQVLYNYIGEPVGMPYVETVDASPNTSIVLFLGCSKACARSFTRR